MAGLKRSSTANASRGVVYEMSRARIGSPDANGAHVRGDTFGITSAARELSAALHAVEATDEVRAAKVRALRRRIADGTYNPDPRAIAVRLVERGF